MNCRRVLENHRRISVLAGKREIEDMLAFLACKRLKRATSVLSLRCLEVQEKKQGCDHR